MEPGPPEGLVGIDVPDPRDPRLAEQERLERRCPTRRQLEQPLGGELARQWLDTEARGEEVIELIAGIQHDRLPEAAHVREQQRPAVVELETSPDMTRLRLRVVEPCAADRLALHQVRGRALLRIAE